jgi:hypothetical protein
MQQFFSLLSWRLFTAQHVSDVFPPIIRSSMTAVAASCFTFISWWQSCCVRGRAGRPDHVHTCCPVLSSAAGRGRVSRPNHDQQHCYHYAPKVKPEAATAVGASLMMGVRTPATRRVVNKRQVINWRDCYMWLVHLFELYDDART